MIIPPIADPYQYAGLFLYDFGSHVSIGYTAKEIHTLREIKKYRDGTAYEIYRVTEDGRFELRAVSDVRLSAVEALAFLRNHPEDAKKDYDALVQAAGHDPTPCTVELILAKIYSFDPSNISAMIYPTTASSAISAWLKRTGMTPGDQVVGGSEVYADIAADQNLRIATCKLTAAISHTDRSREEILASVDQPLQR